MGRRRGPGRRYSRLVRSLRLLLPLLAAALLLLAVLWPRMEWQNSLQAPGLSDAISTVGFQEVRMIGARLVGSDEEGRPFTLNAREVLQPDGVTARIVLVGPQGEIRLEDGAFVGLRADSGEYDRDLERVDFEGNVVVTHGLGYWLETEAATVDIEEGRAFGDKPISGIGPEGSLSGSGFEILDRGKTVKVLGRSRLVITEVPERL